jgi:hypothetical protein
VVCWVCAAGRTVPSDVFQAFAASQLMFQDFGATRVGLVFESNTYGHGLVDNLAAAGDCVLCQLDWQTAWQQQVTVCFVSEPEPCRQPMRAAAVFGQMLCLKFSVTGGLYGAGVP